MTPQVNDVINAVLDELHQFDDEEILNVFIGYGARGRENLVAEAMKRHDIATEAGFDAAVNEIVTICIPEKMAQDFIDEKI